MLPVVQLSGHACAHDCPKLFRKSFKEAQLTFQLASERTGGGLLLRDAHGHCSELRRPEAAQDEKAGRSAARPGRRIQLELVEDKLRELRLLTLDPREYDDRTVTMSQLDRVRQELLATARSELRYVTFGKVRSRCMPSALQRARAAASSAASRVGPALLRLQSAACDHDCSGMLDWQRPSCYMPVFGGDRCAQQQ